MYDTPVAVEGDIIGGLLNNGDNMPADEGMAFIPFIWKAEKVGMCKGGGGFEG
jgi:hypothetical protein